MGADIADVDCASSSILLIIEEEEKGMSVLVSDLLRVNVANVVLEYITVIVSV